MKDRLNSYALNNM